MWGGGGGRDVARILKGEGELLGGRCVRRRREKLLGGGGISLPENFEI